MRFTRKIITSSYGWAIIAYAVIFGLIFLPATLLNWLNPYPSSVGQFVTTIQHTLVFSLLLLTTPATILIYYPLDALLRLVSLPAIGVRWYVETRFWLVLAVSLGLLWLLNWLLRRVTSARLRFSLSLIGTALLLALPAVLFIDVYTSIPLDELF